tara:strand:- start:161 stop:397 length:237 start_codon:yes stop_codon:yes gene_type:complete
MKKLTIILLFLFVLTGTANAAKVKFLDKNTTVNLLTEQGWKLHTVSSSDYIITYTLISFGEVITCKVDSQDNVKCFKP